MKPAHTRRRASRSTSWCASFARRERCRSSAIRSIRSCAGSTRRQARRRHSMRVGRIPYINCYPVYGAIDRGVVKLDASLVDGTPSELNGRIARGDLDVSVVSAVEYARDSNRYVLLPDLAVSCDGPVRIVML